MTENINGLNIKVYDNGGRTFDRYTVIYVDQIEDNGMGKRLPFGVFMSDDPTHPQGVFIRDQIEDSPRLGDVIPFASLPKKCQKSVLEDVEEILAFSN